MENERKRNEQHEKKGKRKTGLKKEYTPRRLINWNFFLKRNVSEILKQMRQTNRILSTREKKKKKKKKKTKKKKKKKKKKKGKERKRKKERKKKEKTKKEKERT